MKHGSTHINLQSGPLRFGYIEKGADVLHRGAKTEVTKGGECKLILTATLWLPTGKVKKCAFHEENSISVGWKIRNRGSGLQSYGKGPGGGRLGGVGKLPHYDVLQQQEKGLLVLAIVTREKKNGEKEKVVA